MKRECGYCKRSMGSKPPRRGPQANEVTTGICPRCLAREQEKLRRRLAPYGFEEVPHGMADDRDRAPDHVGSADAAGDAAVGHRRGPRWCGFAPNVTEADAVAAFEARYGYKAAEIKHTGGALLLGPVLEKENET